MNFAAASPARTTAMQQPQHGRGAQQADEQQHHTGNGADNGRRVDGLFHVLGVARTVKTRHQQVGKRQRQTDQKDLLGQRAFRQRIRLRLILFFPLSYISLNRARAHRGTASFIRHYATFARWKRQNGAKKNTAPGGASCFLRKISQPRSSPLVAMTCLYQSKLFFL